MFLHTHLITLNLRRPDETDSSDDGDVDDEEVLAFSCRESATDWPVAATTARV